VDATGKGVGIRFGGRGNKEESFWFFFFLFSISSGERYLVLSLLGSHSFSSSSTLLPCFCHPGLGREEEFGSSVLWRQPVSQPQSSLNSDVIGMCLRAKR
jgi:hypothetical protein